MSWNEDTFGGLAGSRISQDQIGMLKSYTLHVLGAGFLDLLWAL